MNPTAEEDGTRVSEAHVFDGEQDYVEAIASTEVRMGWQEAGIAWSARARDWAYFMEPLFLPLYEQLAVAPDVGPGTDLLDVGCGAGLGIHRYQSRGADVVGVDAAAGLLTIAKCRVPSAELHHASLTDMPLADSSFDAVTGVNSFVYADDGGLREAHRVLRPGGSLALGFWSDPRDFGWAMAALGEALIPHVGDGDTHTPLRMSEPGAAAGLLADAGLHVLDSGTVTSVSEFPDAEVAYRALASTGMMYPLTESGDELALRTSSMEILRAQERADSGIRMAAAFGWVVAQRT